MATLIEADYNQGFLFPPSLEDFVPKEHPARFIREFVEGLDLKKEGFNIKIKEGAKGGPTYSPRLLLCGWLYGYMNKIRTTRTIEMACYNDVGMMWIMGLHKPDHNTFWRFWDENRKAIKNLFRKTVTLASSMGLLKFVFHALDGTKIMSVGSKAKSFNKKYLEGKLERLEQAIDEILKETEAEAAGAEGSYGLPEELNDKEKLKEKIEEKLKLLETHGVKHLHPQDTDARMMKMKSKNMEMCYNAQAISDGDSGIIVAEEVVNDENDQALLNLMLEEVRENTGRVAEQTLADSGYDTEEELHQAELNEFPVLVNRKDKHVASKNSYHKKHFKYDKKSNCFICPHTKTPLSYERSKYNKSKKKQLKIYRCKNKSCPHRDTCSTDKRGKTIEMSKHYQASANQNVKQESEEAKATLKKRGQVIELLFAWIKEHSGFRRSLFRGLEKVQNQWSMICTVQNLKKLLPLWAKGEINFKQNA